MLSVSRQFFLPMLPAIREQNLRNEHREEDAHRPRQAAKYAKPDTVEAKPEVQRQPIKIEL